MIELVDFFKSYEKDSFAVENINLKAEKGKITGLLGLNGAGKTTIIKAVTSQHYPTSGTVKITGKNGEVFSLPQDCEKALAETGYVPEIFSFPHRFYTGEYLDLVAQQFAVSKKTVNDTIKLCQLEESVSKKIGNLSKGYRQRLALAQALLNDPENIVLDEPVNGLDPAQIIQMRKLVKKIAETRTVLISTHLMQEVDALCDYVYIISGKTVSASGTPEEILLSTGASCMEEAFLKITGTGGTE